jgi:hypothetical protein
MGKVVSHMTMSLDGFIADPHDGVAELPPRHAPALCPTAYLRAALLSLKLRADQR